jgi:hypothetical protein
MEALRRSPNMNSVENKVSIKVIGSNGQISLGKQFAGRQVLVEEREPGVWLVRTASVVPDNERWLHQPQARDDLERALEFAQRHPAEESDPNLLLKDLQRGQHRKQKQKRPARPK